MRLFGGFAFLSLAQHYRPGPSGELWNRLGRVSVVAQVQHVEPNQQNAAPADEARPPNEQAPDFLDALYRVVRILILVALVVYSPVERLAFVVLLICLMMYVQQRRERNGRNAPLGAAQVGGEAISKSPVQEAPPAEEANDSPAPGQSAWSVFWSTVVSFFSSLVPENPVPLNVN